MPSEALLLVAGAFALIAMIASALFTVERTTTLVQRSGSSCATPDPVFTARSRLSTSWSGA